MSKITLLIISIFILSGCTLGSDNEPRELKRGTDGLVISFSANAPQDTYVISDYEEPISMIIEVRNKGSYPLEDDINILSRGQVYLSGFDQNFIYLDSTQRRLNSQHLLGATSFNPDGGFDTLEFRGKISADSILVERYDPIILATLCYPYVTKTSPSVCLDPSPFDFKQEKVCTIGSQTLPNQGAPVQITTIDQEASSTKIQFRIGVKNVGGGDVINLNKLEQCNPFSQGLDLTDFDVVTIERAEVGFARLQCNPNPIKLFEGEGFTICDLNDYDDVQSAYTTPLNLELKYGYRYTTSKQIKINKIRSVS